VSKKTGKLIKPRKPRKPIKFLKKPAGSVRFYKQKTKKTKSNRTKTDKKPSQTEKTEQNRENRAKTGKTEPNWFEPVFTLKKRFKHCPAFQYIKMIRKHQKHINLKQKNKNKIFQKYFLTTASNTAMLFI
jgi:hypothetical protein